MILIQYLVQNSTKPKTTPDVNLATFPVQAVSLPTSGPPPSQLIHQATKVLVQTANTNFWFISTCLHTRSSPVRSLLPAVKMSSQHWLSSLLVKSEMVKTKVPKANEAPFLLSGCQRLKIQVNFISCAFAF